MFRNIFQVRKVKTVARRSTVLRLEILEDRTVPSGNGIWAPDATPLFGPAIAGTSAFASGPVSALPAAPASASSIVSSTSTSANGSLVTLTLNPLDLNLLGLEVKTSSITINVAASPGNGQLLGNVLNSVSSLLNLNQVSAALNSVLASTVTLVNSADLGIAGVGKGPLTKAQASTTQVLQLSVAPVHLDLLGVTVDTSPITLSITAHSGKGLVLGNVVTDLANLFNPPLPGKLDINVLNASLQNLLSELNQQIPGVTPAPVPTTVAAPGQILNLAVPALNVNLLGLELQTSPITVNATAQSGPGNLLGNVLDTALNTLGATPQNLADLNNTLNSLLAKVVGVLNASTLTVSSRTLNSLPSIMKTLLDPKLTAPLPGSTAPILDLVIASSNGTTPPVNVNLLGLQVTTSNIDARLTAVTGTGQVLGNLLYNLANLANPGGSAGLLNLLNQLGAGAQKATGLGANPQNTGSSALAAPQQLLQVKLNPLDVNLLGLEVQTDAITVTVSSQSGGGALLGNLLSGITTLLNVQGVNNALNNVLASTVNLANSLNLNVAGVSSGALNTAATATTPVLNLYVAPVHLDLLGLEVDTSPIHLTITAHAGTGLILGNVVTDLANLFNPPLPQTLDMNSINAALKQLLAELNQQIPSIPSAPVPVVTAAPGQILNLTVPPINLNLLGLVLQTSAITVNATAQTGNGLLLGNVLTTALNTLGATPQNLADLNNNLNAVLAKVVGVLNATVATLPATALTSLPPVLQTLALPTLITPTTNATTSILNLAIASPSGSSAAPVDLNLLGLNVTTSNITANLSAQTGNGQILGNLLYNVANLFNPGGSPSLLALLGQLGQLTV